MSNRVGPGYPVEQDGNVERIDTTRMNAAERDAFYADQARTFVEIGACVPVTVRNGRAIGVRCARPGERFPVRLLRATPPVIRNPATRRVGERRPAVRRTARTSSRAGPDSEDPEPAGGRRLDDDLIDDLIVWTRELARARLMLAYLRGWA